MEGVQDEMASMQESASARGAGFGVEAGESGPVEHVDSSRKAFFKDFVKVVEAADVILEVIDARDPIGGRCLDVERFVRRVDPSKKIVLLLNKVDLVPREVVEAWLKHLREELPAVAFKSSTQHQSSGLGQRSMGRAGSATASALVGSACLGADVLLQLLKNYARNSGLKTSLTVGVVGLPNVGKSSVINSLKRARVAQVGNTPGVTRAVQEIHLDKQITLLDSPGVVFADTGADGLAAAVLRNCVKIEQLSDPILPVMEIVRRCPAKQLMVLYKVPHFDGASELLQAIATSRGKLKRGGAVDVEAAARIVLQDWNSGKIAYYTMPPTREVVVEGSSVVVPAYSVEFDSESVFAAERVTVIDELPTLEAAQGFATPSLGATAAAALDQDSDSDSDAMDVSDTVSRIPKAAKYVGEVGERVKGTVEGGSQTWVIVMRESVPANTHLDTSSPPYRKADSQHAVLYAQEGQFNPHSARAERKKQRKSKRQVEADDSGSDFEFEA